MVSRDVCKEGQLNWKTVMVKVACAALPLYGWALRLFFSDEFLFSLIKRKTHLLVIAPPKTGSTWLSVMLEEALHWPQIDLASSYCQREQEIDPRKFIQGVYADTVLLPHLHLRYSVYTERLIKEGGVKCVLLVRNIFDTIVSFADHCERLGLSWPMFYMDSRNWSELSYEAKLAAIVDLVVPWYFNFYAGWFSKRDTFSGQMVMVRYEDLVSDTDGTLREVLEALAIAPSEKVAIDRTGHDAEQKTLKNVGVVGRGAKLPVEIVKKIERFASYYPSVDFSPIGLSFLR